eukprot:m.351385 g.351385  ORF g.351385 m.351385 type:complete len:137 (+) comp16238_c0_seq1:350-760(+)
MHVEVATALDFIFKLARDQFPQDALITFKSVLAKRLVVRFQGHWFVDQPHRGCAYRCIHKTHLTLDEDLMVASKAAKIDFRTSIPPSFTIWIDPGEVSVRIGEDGSVFDIPLLAPQDEQVVLAQQSIPQTPLSVSA